MTNEIHEVSEQTVIYKAQDILGYYLISWWDKITATKDNVRQATKDNVRFQP